MYSHNQHVNTCIDFHFAKQLLAAGIKHGSKQTTSMSKNYSNDRIFWIGLGMFTMYRENLTEMGFEKPK